MAVAEQETPGYFYQCIVKRLQVYVKKAWQTGELRNESVQVLEENVECGSASNGKIMCRVRLEL